MSGVEMSVSRNSISRIVDPSAKQQNVHQKWFLLQWINYYSSHAQIAIWYYNITICKFQTSKISTFEKKRFNLWKSIRWLLVRYVRKPKSMLFPLTWDWWCMKIIPLVFTSTSYNNSPGSFKMLVSSSQKHDTLYY